MEKQVGGEELQCVAELEEELKKLEEERRPRSIEEQDVMRCFEEEGEEIATRTDTGEIRGKGKGKGERRKRRERKQPRKTQGEKEQR